MGQIRAIIGILVTYGDRGRRGGVWPTDAHISPANAPRGPTRDKRAINVPHHKVDRVRICISDVTFSGTWALISSSSRLSLSEN